MLCIDPKLKKIIVGEVKDFSFAKNPYEMDQEYRRMFVDTEKPCYMSKHNRRVEWITNHIEDVKTHFNLSGGKWKVYSVLFVSDEIISNKFFHKKERIIVYTDISAQNIKRI